MAFNVISATNGKEIPPGMYPAIVYGVADLGPQPGFNPGDLPQDKFALLLRIAAANNEIYEWAEVYGYKFTDKSNLKLHLAAGGLITPADVIAGLKPPDLIGRTVNVIFGTGTRADGTEKSKLLGMTPLKEPLSAATLAALKAGGKLIYDRSAHDEAMFQRLPPWIRAKVTPNQVPATHALPAAAYPQPVAPAIPRQSPTPAAAPASTPFFAAAWDSPVATPGPVSTIDEVFASTPAAPPVTPLTLTPAAPATPAAPPAAPATAPANSALDAW